jgi:hypothetical protein
MTLGKAILRLGNQIPSCLRDHGSLETVAVGSVQSTVRAQSWDSDACRGIFTKAMLIVALPPIHTVLSLDIWLKQQ